MYKKWLATPAWLPGNPQNNQLGRLTGAQGPTESRGSPRCLSNHFWALPA